MTRADIMEFDENSAPADAQGRAMYSERLIQGEIFRARPDVIAVVHSHSLEVVAFGVTKAPFQVLVHVADFLGITPWRHLGQRKSSVCRPPRLSGQLGHGAPWFPRGQGALVRPASSHGS